MVQLWQGPWDPWDPSRSVSPQHRAGRKPPRGSRQALTGAGPGRRRSHPLGPCCWPRRPSSPARGRGRPVAVLRPALAPRTRAPCWKQHLVASARLWGSRRGPFPELSSPGGPFPEPSPPPTTPSSLWALVAGSRASQVEGGVGRGAGVAHSQAGQAEEKLPLVWAPWGSRGDHRCLGVRLLGSPRKAGVSGVDKAPPATHPCHHGAGKQDRARDLP